MCGFECGLCVVGAAVCNLEARYLPCFYHPFMPLPPACAAAARRHLTFAAEAAAAGIRGPTRPSRLVVCRARRAWLPPSSLWLFKPLSYTHDIGE
jgi:hypothetical protein